MFYHIRMGGQKILRLPFSKSEGHIPLETRSMPFCIFCYVCHAIVLGTYSWVALISPS